MTKKEEIWLPVRSYESIYRISSLGRIKNINTRGSNKEKVLTPCLSNRGYFIINLCVNGTQKSRTIHQLVAEAFHGHIPCGHKKVINHINLNKLDNRAVNLEIVSNRDNCNMKHFKHSSKYTGVCYLAKSNNWKSHIVIQGKLHHIGMFKNEIDAHLSYEKALKDWDENQVKPLKKEHSSECKGVSFNKRTGKWIAYIDGGIKRIQLGYFTTEQKAIEAIKNFKEN